MEKDENIMPMGLGFGLAMNEKAMTNFASMKEDEKKQVIETARNVQSKREMQNLISDIAELNSMS